MPLSQLPGSVSKTLPFGSLKVRVAASALGAGTDSW